MKNTFNAYTRIYPNVFNQEAVKEFDVLLKEGFLINNEVNEKFVSPEKIQYLIKRL